MLLAIAGPSIGCCNPAVSQNALVLSVLEFLLRNLLSSPLGFTHTESFAVIDILSIRDYLTCDPATVAGRSRCVELKAGLCRVTELHVHNAIEFTERRSKIGTLAYREGRRPLGQQIQSTQLLVVDCNTKQKYQLDFCDKS